jgi:phage gpG-like protein
MQVIVTISGSKQLQRRLKNIDLGMHNLAPAFAKIGQQAADYYMTQGFLSQGGVFNHKWSPLNHSYAVRKAKTYPGRPPLVRTGKMLSGFRYQADNTSVTIGNRMPYFKYHQSTRADRHKMPWRPMMGINEDIKRIARTEIAASISSAIKKAT